jgi:hypothetical protein
LVLSAASGCGGSEEGNTQDGVTDGESGGCAGTPGGSTGSGGSDGTSGSDAEADTSVGGTGGTGGSGADAGVDGTSGSDGGSDVNSADGNASDAVADGFSGPVCVIGEESSDATASDPSLFGTPVYFNAGNPLPAGTYGVTYVDGCMKYASNQGWTVNNYDPGCCNWWIIGETTADRKIVPPGTVGLVIGAGAFANFADCENASRAAAPRTFVHSGGRLGLWLQDSPYTDNFAGQDGRNPKWRLVRLGGECLDGGTSTDRP